MDRYYLSVEQCADYRGEPTIAITQGSNISRHALTIHAESVDGLIALLTLAKVFEGEHKLEVDPETGKPGALTPAPQSDELPRLIVPNLGSIQQKVWWLKEALAKHYTLEEEQP
jgi:hypothetical protein